MSVISISAKRYASVLFELAQESNKVEQVKGEIEQFLALYEVDDLRDFLDSPKVSKSAKIRLLQTLLLDKVSELSIKFLSVLVTKNYLPLISQIVSAYQDLMSSALGKLKVTVYTSKEQTTDLVEMVETQLRKLLKAQDIEIEKRVSQSIMGGIKIRIGDDLIDGSVQNRLKVMKEQLARGAVS